MVVSILNDVIFALFIDYKVPYEYESIGNL